MEYIPRNCDSFKIDFYALEHSLPLSLSVRFIQLKEARANDPSNFIACPIVCAAHWRKGFPTNPGSVESF